MPPRRRPHHRMISIYLTCMLITTSIVACQGWDDPGDPFNRERENTKSDLLLAHPVLDLDVPDSTPGKIKGMAASRLSSGLAFRTWSLDEPLTDEAWIELVHQAMQRGLIPASIWCAGDMRGAGGSVIIDGGYVASALVSTIASKHEVRVDLVLGAGSAKRAHIPSTLPTGVKDDYLTDPTCPAAIVQAFEPLGTTTTLPPPTAN